MNVLVTGSSGLVGSALKPFLKAQGHTVIPLLRRATSPTERAICWDPEEGELTPQELEGVEAVVHLAGENIAGRWTPEKKRRIRESRVQGTLLLAQALAKTASPPKVLVSASAVGIYGDRADEVLTEASAAGDGFLAEVCREWEAAAAPAAAAGIRVVCTRFGMVLSPRGGALAKMLPPFKMGVGGRVGSGRQYWSWISLDDVVEAIGFALQTDSVRGAVNVAAPEAPDNREFTKTLGRVLSRPTIFPLPAAIVRLAFGEMGEATLLASARVAPAKLLANGFEFRYPQLEGALRHLL